MADSSIAITGGNVDTATQANGDHRQVIAVGDPVSSQIAAVVSGALVVDEIGAGTAVRTSVAGATSNTLILAANTVRQGFAVFNQSTASLYLAYGTAAASTSSFTVIVPPSALWEDPWRYRGEVRGIWDAAAGNARITELT